MQVPYRTQLRGTGDDETTRHLYRILEARERSLELPDIHDVIGTANEIVLWQLVFVLRDQNPNRPYYGVRFVIQPGSSAWSRDQNPNRPYCGVWPREWESRLEAVARLIARAIRDADAEGVVWTPLLDVLAETTYWHSAVQNEDIRVRFGLPMVQERLGLLKPWVAETQDFPLLKGMLRFRSPLVPLIVARHTVVLDEDIIRALPLSADIAEALVENPAFNDELAAAFMRRAYQEWRAAVRGEHDATSLSSHASGEDAHEALGRMLDHGFSLPDDLRADILEIARRDNDDEKPTEAVQFLLVDEQTPEDVIRQLPRRLLDYHAISALSHPNTPLDLWEELADDEDNLITALNWYPLSADRVARAYNRYVQHGLNPSCLLNILRQEHSTSDMWCAALADPRPDVYRRALVALSHNPNARLHPKVREALLVGLGILNSSDPSGEPPVLDGNDAVRVAGNLLQDRRSEDFEPLMLVSFKYNPDFVVQILREDGIPSDVPPPTRLLTELLGSADGEHRVVGITLLSALNAENQAFALAGASRAEGAPDAARAASEPSDPLTAARTRYTVP